MIGIKIYIFVVVINIFYVSWFSTPSFLLQGVLYEFNLIYLSQIILLLYNDPTFLWYSLYQRHGGPDHWRLNNDGIFPSPVSLESPNSR